MHFLADGGIMFAFLAYSLARSCQGHGSALPTYWQRFANLLAKVCQGHGHLLALLLASV